ASAGAAGRASGDVRPGLDPGPPGVPDRDRPGRPALPGPDRGLRRGGGEAARRDRRGGAADSLPGAAPPGSAARRCPRGVRGAADQATGQSGRHRPRHHLRHRGLRPAARPGRPVRTAVLTGPRMPKPGPGAGRTAIGSVMFGAAILLAGLNLRPAITSVGPVLDQVRAALGASATWAGLLTALPVFCFAAGGLAAPYGARRIGRSRTVAVALALLPAGLVLRTLAGPRLVIVGTILAAFG